MKKWFHSRTLWVNFLAAVALFVQQQYGYILSPDTQAYVLLVLNFALRFDTKTEIGM